MLGRGAMTVLEIALPPSALEQLVALLNAGKFRRAEREAAKAIRQRPDDLALQNLFGVTLLQQGKSKKARRIFERILAQDRKYAAAYSNLGMALKKTGDLPAAIECYKAAIDLMPRDVAAINNLGNTYHDIGQYEQAVKCFTAALAINPALTLTRNSLAGAYFSLGKFDLALDAIEDSIRRDDTLIISYALKAHYLEKLNRLDEAENFLQGPLSAAPDDPHLLVAMARLDIRRRRFDEARTKLTAALSTPDSLSQLDRSEAGFLLGECLDKLGRHEQAFDAFSRANKLRAQIDDAKYYSGERYHQKISAMSAAIEQVCS